MENKKWAPSQELNLGIITSTYESIKEKLSTLQKETGCPDSFIYDFMSSMRQKINDPLGVRAKKRKEISQR